MSKRRKSMTLAEQDALLKREGRYDEMVDAQSERDEALGQKAAEWRLAEAPLIDELREAGLEVDSAWDLVNTSAPYPAALPILLKHLERPYPDRVREGIARALAVRDAMFAWETIVRLFREEEAGTDAKDGLAVAVAAVANEEVVDEVILLAQDPAHGESRLLLLRGLKRSRAKHGRAALEGFADDPVLGQEARALLGG